MSFSGNIGEWSEAYTLFKVLSEKSLYVGDKDLHKITNLIFPVIKVLRTEKSEQNLEYVLDSDIVVISSDQTEICRIKVSEFTNYASKTFELLKQQKKSGGKGAFELPEIEKFLRRIQCSSIKASSSVKTDITLVIHDTKTNQTPHLGFSIKSQLGGASTLLNAGKTTNFTFKLNGATSEIMEDINAISTRSKIRDRMSALKAQGVSFEFSGASNQVFYNNLVLIDSQMPKIVSELLLEYYNSSESKLSEIVKTIEKANPLGFDTSSNHKFYSYKIKRLLTDIAVGLMPNTIWNGIYDATGGYLIVKETGDIVCYHLYNRNEFEDYLLNNTKFETASSTRHKFGSVFMFNEEYYLNLNLQIRFIK